MLKLAGCDSLEKVNKLTRISCAVVVDLFAPWMEVLLLSYEVRHGSKAVIGVTWSRLCVRKVKYSVVLSPLKSFIFSPELELPTTPLEPKGLCSTDDPVEEFSFGLPSSCKLQSRLCRIKEWNQQIFESCLYWEQEDLATDERSIRSDIVLDIFRPRLF